MKGKMIVVTHKDYDMPKDEVYFPICVGNEIPVLADKFQPDNAGENISDKNACTLHKVVCGSAIEAIFKNEGIHKKDIQRLRAAIHHLAPDYDDYADRVLRGHSAHMLNMFIMNAEKFNNYCTWLFPIIDQVVEWNSDREDQRRYAGALSEFCLDIWIKKNNFKIKELSLLETEKKPFHTKLSGYLKRKIFGK